MGTLWPSYTASGNIALENDLTVSQTADLDWQKVQGFPRYLGKINETMSTLYHLVKVSKNEKNNEYNIDYYLATKINTDKYYMGELWKYYAKKLTTIKNASNDFIYM